MATAESEDQPRKTDKRDYTWQIPPSGIQAATGVEGTLAWGAINRPGIKSRYGIGDSDADDQINFLPIGSEQLQLPANGPTLTTLPSPITWQKTCYLNGNVFIYSFCQNGNIYQSASAGGAVTVVGTGFTTSGTVDIVEWQGTQILFSDSVAQKIYSWNGSTLSTLLSSQPVQYIAVYSGRLWIMFNATIEWTAGGTNNSLSGDSGSFLITNNLLTNPILGALDCPAGLYVVAANWCVTINGLTDIGSPAVLTFQFTPLEGNIGPLSKWSLMLVGSTVMFANSQGIWSLQGTTPVQISAPQLNGFFANLNFSLTNLSGAYGMYNSVPCVFYQAYYNGDTQVPAGTCLFGFTIQNQQWFRVATGTIAWVTGICSSALTNNTPQIFGCDGTNIYQFFAGTTPVTSQWNSKLWYFPPETSLDEDNVLSIAAEVILTTSATITVAQLDQTGMVIDSDSNTYSPSLIQFVNNSGQPITFVNNSGAAINWSGNVPVSWQTFQADGIGRCRRFGMNISITSVGASLVSLYVSYHKTQAARGS